MLSKPVCPFDDCGSTMVQYKPGKQKWKCWKCKRSWKDGELNTDHYVPEGKRQF